MKMKMKLVVWTDKGYLKGDIHQGVSFVEKDDASVFTEDQALIYRSSIADDLFEFYDVREMRFEQL